MEFSKLKAFPPVAFVSLLTLLVSCRSGGAMSHARARCPRTEPLRVVFFCPLHVPFSSGKESAPQRRSWLGIYRCNFLLSPLFPLLLDPRCQRLPNGPPSQRRPGSPQHFLARLAEPIEGLPPQNLLHRVRGCRRRVCAVRLSVMQLESNRAFVSHSRRAV